VGEKSQSKVKNKKEEFYASPPMPPSNNHRVHMLAEGLAEGLAEEGLVEEGLAEGLVHCLCSSHILCTMKDRFCRYTFRDLGIWE
jgi:hypothetical protein